MIELRDPYQAEAVPAVWEAFKKHHTTICKLPTGTGKTVVFAKIIEMLESGRAMVLAHNRELIWQAAKKIEEITGERPDIEMAEYKADATVYRRAPSVVASVATLYSNSGEPRINKFDPMDFGLLVIDEAHRATADRYRKVIAYFRQNPNLKILLVTATPNRSDKVGLCNICESVAYDYEIQDAVSDGWLVPIRQRIVRVESIDFSNVKTTAGDLDKQQLAEEMTRHKTLHGICAAIIDTCGDRTTLIFAASVDQAKRTAEILNRHKPDSARWVCGTTPKYERAQMNDDFATGRFQYLVNMGTHTEGFDCPAIRNVVMARGTLSSLLYTQMLGRGTRPLPGLVDSGGDAQDRRDAIADSDKPYLDIIDFAGNAGKHKLVSSVDILAGDVAPAIRDRAQEIVEQAEEPVEIDDAVKEAEHQLEMERLAIAEQRRQWQAERMRGIRARVTFSDRIVDPWNAHDRPFARTMTYDSSATPSQLKYLKHLGLKRTDYSKSAAGRIIGKIKERKKKGLCNLLQAQMLRDNGVDPTDVTLQEAADMLIEIDKAKKMMVMS